MTCYEFCEVYWAHYISIEKEFLETTSFVTLDEDNKKTYSGAFLKLLLAIGSEVDVVMKFYCGLLDTGFSGDKMTQYCSCINTHKSIFFTQEVSVRNGLMTIKPWSNQNEADDIISPIWWKVYNKCKHERIEVGEIKGDIKEYYKFANLENVLAALAGLYQTILYSYKILADNESKKVVIPLPGSRLFTLSGPEWNNVHFFNDFALYMDDDGNLFFESGNIYF